MLVLVNKVLTETYEDRPGREESPQERQKYVYRFTEAEHIVIDGALHGLGTPDLGITVYERLGTRLHVVSAEIYVESLAFDVTITLLQPMTGQVVLLA